MENIAESPEIIERTGEFFPSIEQFRHVVRAERETAAFHGVMPAKRQYIGTVKLHGTNAGISLIEGNLIYRSRTREITLAEDNHGFVRHMYAHEDTVRGILGKLGSNGSIFGEWCGAGIQNNVGISAEPKMFVVFAAKVNGEWIDANTIDRNPMARIFNIRDYPIWIREIDFGRPEQVQNDLIALTEAVEAECPVAKAFGHSGIGEGIVWRPHGSDRGSRYWFKVKGEKHSASKVKVLAAVDVERYHRREEIVAAVVTENRLQQGLDLHVGEFGRPLEIQGIGEFLRWVFNDVAKEEADTIKESGFELKELGKSISGIAKRFYVAAVNRNGDL